MATTGAFLDEVYQNAVEAEVNKRSTTLSNLADNAKDYQREISAYEDLKARLDTLSTASKELYGFRSPFRNFVGTGDGIPDYFTVTANRLANTTTYDIAIRDIAASQKFSSKAFNMSDTLPAGKIVLKIGEEETTIDFAGGSLVNLQKAMDKAFGKKIKTTITQKSRTLQVLTMDLVKTGSKNIVEVVSDDAGILKELNMFTRRPYRYLGHIFNQELLSKWEDESDNLTTNYMVKNDFIVLQGENKLSLPLHREAEANENITLSITARVSDSLDDAEEPPIMPPTVDLSIPDTGVTFNKIDSVIYKDVELYGEGLSPADSSRTFEDIKKYKEALEAERKAKEGVEAEAPEPIDATGFNAEIIGVKYINKAGDEVEKFFALPTISSSWQRLNIPIGGQFEEGDVITEVVLINKNAGYNVFYKDLLIEDMGREEDAPNYLISEATDARASIDGVDVLSDTNEFNDVVNGLNITAKKVTPEAFATTIEVDKEKVVDGIVNFISAYNDVIDLLNDTTQRPLSRDIRDGIENMNRTELIDLATTLGVEYNPEMPDSALKKKLYYVGVFSGNTLVSTISQRIRMIVADSYETEYGEELALLDQIGINRGNAGEEWSKVKKGFLQVDEEKFMNKIETQMDGIEELFSNDITGDDIPDTGVAYTMSDFVTPYSQTRGIVENSIMMTRNRMEDNKKRMDDEKDRIEEYRQQRLASYYKMQGELQQAERERKRLESSLNQNAGGN
ncbi:flagellar filament capping protein FliD [Brachyspira innocens]|uniref:Flagellar hook-associated protein 2 n=1 Tax=Brachyspira innocens TaxID=13264 RepID=A0ABT8YVI7_9SPIR|nr:flagellar filament capping protein FliD [Brachyspira innocens]MDO6994875.1 flagellar filament capping protein FliD [Brachyspira innocens]MDO7019858.1 flagellar filament capping protein FliD [Brachyspira innocens]